MVVACVCGRVYKEKGLSLAVDVVTAWLGMVTMVK